MITKSKKPKCAESNLTFGTRFGEKILTVLQFKSVKAHMYGNIFSKTTDNFNKKCDNVLGQCINEEGYTSKTCTSSPTTSLLIV